MPCVMFLSLFPKSLKNPFDRIQNVVFFSLVPSRMVLSIYQLPGGGGEGHGVQGELGLLLVPLAGDAGQLHRVGHTLARDLLSLLHSHCVQL